MKDSRSSQRRVHELHWMVTFTDVCAVDRRQRRKTRLIKGCTTTEQGQCGADQFKVAKSTL